MTTNTETKIWRAMWNMPGCLPESDPFVTLSEKDAREYLADQLDTIADDLDANPDQPSGDRITLAAEEVRKGESDAVDAGGYVYTITSDTEPIDEDEARRVALAVHLSEDLSDIEAASYGENMYQGPGGEWLVLDDVEADTSARESILDSVWAFNADFLASYFPGGLTPEDVNNMRGDRCEDFNPAALALITAGSGLDSFVEDAIGADGRGHFLAGYDFEEGESEGFYIYRTN